MDEKELIQKLKLIKYHLYEAAEFHSRSDLHSANEHLDKLLKELGVDVPYYLPNNWLKDDENEQ